MNTLLSIANNPTSGNQAFTPFIAIIAFVLILFLATQGISLLYAALAKHKDKRTRTNNNTPKHIREDEDSVLSAEDAQSRLSSKLLNHPDPKVHYEYFGGYELRTTERHL